MNVIELTAPRFDAFRLATRPQPSLSRGEVLLRMRAASLNFLDIAIADGSLELPGSSFPMVPVTDGAGEIAELGADVSGWAIGDRVIPHFLPFWQDGAQTSEATGLRRGVSMPGSLADYVAVPAASLVPIPDHLSFVEAATLPIAATTAWRAIRAASLAPGSTALILGTGVVSLFALQFAKAHGARVIVTSSSDDKLARARTLGADEAVNYREKPDWEKEVLRLTEGRGVDLVLETGGARTLSKSIEAAATNGTIFVIGFLSGREASIDVLAIMEKSLRIVGNTVGPVAALRAATGAIGALGLKPVIDKIYAFEEARPAFERATKDGARFGKIAFVF